MPRRLTLKQQAFAQALATAPSATAAARRAGYSDNGGPMIRVTAAENLAKPHVMAAVPDGGLAPHQLHQLAAERTAELHAVPVKSRRGLGASAQEVRYLELVGRWRQMDASAAAAPAPVQINVQVLVADPTSRAAMSLLARKLAAAEPFREHSAHDDADGTGPSP